MTDSRLGTLHAGMAGDEWLRWVAVDVTGPLTEAAQLRDLSPVAATALGRALSGVALLYRHALRTPSRLTLSVLGDGPLGEVTAEMSGSRFRGRVGAPQLDNEYFGARNQRLGQAVGSGRLEVLREGERGAFRSHSDLVTGEIGSDLAHYLLQSEQTRSAISLGEVLSAEGVTAAGGFLIEALPGTPDEILSRIEDNLSTVPAWSESLAGVGLETALDEVLEGLAPTVRERDRLEYRCGCDKAVILQRLQGLPSSDLRDLKQADALTAECDYCGESYEFEPQDLDASPAVTGIEPAGLDVQ